MGASGEAVVTTSKLCRVTVNATVLQVFKRSSVDLCTQCSPDRFEILTVSFALLETWGECCGRLVIFRVTLRAWLPMPSHNTVALPQLFTLFVSVRSGNSLR